LVFNGDIDDAGIRLGLAHFPIPGTTPSGDASNFGTANFKIH
jgi:hypothetical protein